MHTSTNPFTEWEVAVVKEVSTTEQWQLYFGSAECSWQLQCTSSHRCGQHWLLLSTSHCSHSSSHPWMMLDMGMLCLMKHQPDPWIWLLLVQLTRYLCYDGTYCPCRHTRCWETIGLVSIILWDKQAVACSFAGKRKAKQLQLLFEQHGTRDIVLGD